MKTCDLLCRKRNWCKARRKMFTLDPLEPLQTFNLYKGFFP